MVAAGVIFGIGAALGWGASDFFASSAIKKTDSIRTAFWTQFISFLIMLLLAPLFPGFTLPPLSLFLIIGFTTLFTVAAFLVFYHGLSIGQMSIIAPVSGCYSVITVLIVTLLFSEKLSLLQLGGVGSAIFGTILVSFQLSELRNKKMKAFSSGVRFALLAMVLWGVYFALLDQIILEFNWYFALLYIRFFMVIYLLAYPVARKKSLFVDTDRKAAKTWMVIGFMQFAAFLSFGFGVNSDLTSIVAPVAAASPAVTVALARIFLKEKLEFNQNIGVLLILLGLVLLAL